MGKNHYIIPIFVPHEGCPHNCVFCNQNIITGNEEKVDATFVVNTVEQYLQTIDNKEAIIEISFFGGTFTAINIDKQRELLKVAKDYKEAGKIKYIRLSTRPDAINSFILDNLKQYKVDIIELGVQSLNDEVLKLAGRGHTKAEVYSASKLIKEYGFTLGHQIMPGLPGDTFERDMDTVERVISIKPDICRIYPALVIKDTPMEVMYLRNEYKPYGLNEAVEISKKLYGKLISNDIEVIRIGLQPTEEINKDKEVVAGPFHPAFRELVLGSIYKDMIESNVPKDFKGNIVLGINNRDISKLYSNKKYYFNELKGTFKNVRLTVIQDSKMPREQVNLEIEGGLKKELLVKKYLEIYR